MELKDVVMALTFLGTGGALGSWLSEWLRNRREERVRWHAERRAAYGHVLAAGERIYDSEILIAKHVGNLRRLSGWGQDPLFDEEHLLRQAEKLEDEWASYCISKVGNERPKADDAHDQLMSALATVEMLSDPAVVHTARAYRDALHSLMLVAAHSPPHECGGWSEAGVEASELVAASREAFVGATRKELGVE